jgi:hypothetical protein
LDEVLSHVKNVEDDVLVRNEVQLFLRGLLDRAAFQKQGGKLSAEVVHRLIGNENAAMQRELDKYEFIEGAEGGEEIRLKLEISKRRAHAAAGLNMGVCVAVDDQLWNKEAFSNVILWDEQGTALGGMHFEIVESEGEKYLSLPGINPSTAILSKINPERLYDAMISFAQSAARQIGASSVLVPVRQEIHSNREELHTVVLGKEYKQITLTGPHEFSYSPFSYSWQDAYVIDVDYSQAPTDVSQEGRKPLAYKHFENLAKLRLGN